MKILGVRFRNVCSYGNRWTEISFGTHRKILGVIGPKGSGKTSAFFDSVFFVLFGKPFRDVNKRDIINWTNDAELEVEMTLQVGPDIWVIRRGMKPDFLKIIKNGKETALDSHVLMTQKFLEKKVIGVNQQIFTQVFMVALGDFKSFFVLPTGDRRTMFEEILRVTVFAEMLKDMKAREKKIERELADAQIELKVVSEKTETFRQQVKKIQEVQHQDREKDALRLSAIQQEKEPLEKELKELRIAIRQCESTLSSLETDFRVHEGQVAILGRNAKFYETNSTCQTCKQPISKEFAQKEIAALTSQKEVAEDLMKANKSDIDELTAVLEEARAEFSEKDAALRAIDAETAAIKRREKESSDSKVLESLMEEIEKSEDRKKRLSDTRDELTGDKGTVALFKSVLSDDGLKRFVYEQFLPTLNQRVNEHLIDFGMDVNFELDENLKERFWRKEGKNIPFASFSNGEKEIIAVSFLFALQKFLEGVYGFSLNVMFTDELLDTSLDLETIEKVIDFIKKDIDKTVVVISHNPSTKDFFDETYLVSKDDAGFSCLERES